MTNISADEISTTEEGLDTYQTYAAKTAIYPEGNCPECGLNVGLVYTMFGLIGEVGEFANKYKKVIRDGSEFTQEDMGKETGDVLWYVSELARQFKMSLGYIASENLKKLFSRQERGVLGGSGDNR